MICLLVLKRWIYRKLISKAKFKKWLELEDIRSRIKDAADQSENEKVSDLLCSYLSAALCHGNWGKLPWEDVLKDYLFSVDKHSPSREFRIFSVQSDKQIFKINDSSWYSWSNLLARTFGWSLEYIAELDINDAISLIQEILYDEQLKKEWEWTLSDKSVHYDKRGKGKFKPLDRPEWMKHHPKPKPLKRHKLPTAHIPPGVVIRWDTLNVEH